MKTQAIFIRAGCTVCIAAEQRVADTIDPARSDIEIVHPGETQSRIGEAGSVRVKSVPALVIGGQPLPTTSMRRSLA